MARLGLLVGKQVLDFGCGHGMASTCLAQAGAMVTAVDLSAGYVDEAVQRGLANGVTIDGIVANGEHLPFADEHFDAIWGVAILHHLQVEQAAMELRRVLKPAGTVVLCEPWGGNAILELARKRLPYVGKERTADESPLRAHDVQKLRSVFPLVSVEFVQLLGMVRRAWRTCPGLTLVDRFDRALLKHHGWLGPWCRYVVLQLFK